MTQFQQRLPYLMHRVDGALQKTVGRALAGFALTPTQLGVLAQLDEVSPEALCAAVLGHRSGVTPQSMSTAVAGLLERGLVDRQPNPTEGRVLDIRITADGAELLKRTHQAVYRAEDRALAFLDAGQQDQLRQLLRLMMREMNLFMYDEDDADKDDADAR